MPRPFVIKGWLAQPDLNVFVRGDRIVRVEPKVMDLCVRLTQSPGTVVSKNELLESVWPNTTVGEDALTRTVSELRRALEDDSRTPQIIETIPKRGYRLIAPVERPVQTTDRAPIDRSTVRSIALAAVLVLLVMAASAWVWRDAREHRAATVGSSRPMLLLAPFENAAGNSNLEQLVRRSIERQLLRAAQVTFAPQQRVDEGLARMCRPAEDMTHVDTALELAQRDSGISAVITGRLERISNGYAVSAQVTERSGSVLHTFIADGHSEQMLLAAMARETSLLGNTLRDLKPDHVQPLPRVTTSSYRALQLFARAVADADLSSSPAERAISIELLQNALALDSQFAMARVWLAGALKTADVSRVSDRDGALGSAEAYRSHARQALNRTRLLSPPEELFVEGAANALLEQDQKAIAAFEALLWSKADFFEAHARSRLASLYFRQARYSEYAEQTAKVADLLPNDFDRTFRAAEALVAHDRHTGRAASLTARARQLLTPAIAQQHYFAAAWIEILPAYERWVAGDLDGAVKTLETLSRSLATRVGNERDAIGTVMASMWIAVGRVGDARRAAESVGHVGQRQWNLAIMADLLDDRRQAVGLLNAQKWAYNPVPFARAGLFRRANAIMRQPTVGGVGPAQYLSARGEEALAEGRYKDAVSELQHAFELLKARPSGLFYDTAISLARAWNGVGDTSQEILVLVEATRTPPIYVGAGFSGAWWIKAQTHLVRVYREASRSAEADTLEREVRKLLAHADPGFLVPPSAKHAK